VEDLLVSKIEGLILVSLDNPLMEFDWYFQDNSNWMADQRK